MHKPIAACAHVFDAMYSYADAYYRKVDDILHMFLKVPSFFFCEYSIRIYAVRDNYLYEVGGGESKGVFAERGTCLIITPIINRFYLFFFYFNRRVATKKAVA